MFTGIINICILISVEEGVFLYSQGIPVYSGGVFHETPLCLLISSFLIR